MNEAVLHDLRITSARLGARIAALAVLVATRTPDEDFGEIGVTACVAVTEILDRTHLSAGVAGIATDLEHAIQSAIAELASEVAAG